MGTMIKIVTNCCYNCKHKGINFTDGTFECEAFEDCFDTEIKDCIEFEMQDADEDREEHW